MSGLFGGNNSGGGGGLFGNNNNNNNNNNSGGGGLFGGNNNSNNNNNNNSGGGGLFGGNSNNNNSGGGGLFGGNNNNNQTNNSGGGGGLFGNSNNNNNNNTGGGGLFGNNNNNNTGGGGLFGNNNNNNSGGGGLFGPGNLTPEQQLCIDLDQRIDLMSRYIMNNWVEHTYQKYPDEVLNNAINNNNNVNGQNIAINNERTRNYNPNTDGPNEEKWLRARKNNPHPEKCYPVPVFWLYNILQDQVQFESLKDRQIKIRQEVDRDAEEIKNVQKAFASLKNHFHVKMLQKLEQAKHRHTFLQDQLLKVIIKLEGHALQTNSGRRNYLAEGTLNKRYTELEKGVQDTRNKLRELHYSNRCLLMDVKKSNVASLEQDDIGKITSVAMNQMSLLEGLEAELRDAVLMENNLEKAMGML